MALTLKSLQEQQIKLEEQVSEIKKQIEKMQKCKLPIKGNLGIGDKFELAGLFWTILDITEQGYMCLADRLEDSKVFDSSCNNWAKSSLRKYLNKEVFNQIANEIGEKNIIKFERDLLSLDGLDDYGKCEDYVSLLTVDEYRKYRKLIPNTNEYAWWTITPDSVESNNDKTWVRVVSASGGFSYWFCDCIYGVRPFCIFSSAIFESEE